MKKKLLSFKFFYIVYVVILAVLIFVAVLHVRSVLEEYEASLPEKKVEAAMEQLLSDAETGKFWTKYFLPEVVVGRFEEQFDIKSEYITRFNADEVEYVQKRSESEDELYYNLVNDGTVLAEIKLVAAGPKISKFLVLNYRQWKVEHVKPFVDNNDYTITVPNEFKVVVNGIELTAEEGTASGAFETTYTVEGVYRQPSFEITDGDGNAVKYTISNFQVIPEFYYYNLTLPTALKVTVNGEAFKGKAVDQERMRYEVRLLEKPEVIISDFFGNEYRYEGGNKLDLTYMTIVADSRYSVLVDGAQVPVEAVESKVEAEYSMLEGYVAQVPEVCTYNIAVLKKDTVVSVADEKGNPVALEEGLTMYDFTGGVKGLDEVPAEIAAEVDVLENAKNWSLFTSADVPFKEITKYLVADSYQYKVAKQYAGGVDITFFSAHYFANPAFTEETVGNFVWLTEDCFSVDVSFVKHMILSRTGEHRDDPMNERFYYIRVDETNDGVDNPTWKIVGIWKIVGTKENVNNAE